MILLTDIANKLHEIATEIGISEVYQSDNTPFGEVKSERVIVSVGENFSGSIWDELTAVVNVCVPDIDKNGTADLIRLQEAEKKVCKVFNDMQVFQLGEDWISVEWRTSSIEENASLKCHYIHVVLSVKTLNID